MSEPESLVLRRLVRRIDPHLVVTFHQPLFGVGANDKGMSTVRALAAGMRLPVRRFVCTGVCHGTFTGWVNHRTDGLAVTVEFGRTAPAWRIRRAARTAVDVGSGRWTQLAGAGRLWPGEVRGEHRKTRMIVTVQVPPATGWRRLLGTRKGRTWLR